MPRSCHQQYRRYQNHACAVWFGSFARFLWRNITPIIQGFWLQSLEMSSFFFIFCLSRKSEHQQSSCILAFWRLHILICCDWSTDLKSKKQILRRHSKKKGQGTSLPPSPCTMGVAHQWAVACQREVACQWGGGISNQIVQTVVSSQFSFTTSQVTALQVGIALFSEGMWCSPLFRTGRRLQSDNNVTCSTNQPLPIGI